VVVATCSIETCSYCLGEEAVLIQKQRKQTKDLEEKLIIKFILCFETFIYRFLFLFLVSDFLVFEMILFQIPKFKFRFPSLSLFLMFQNMGFEILNPNKELTLIF
jgi:hypothetical protein